MYFVDCFTLRFGKINRVQKYLCHTVFYIQTGINFVPRISHIELQFIVQHGRDVSTSEVCSFLQGDTRTKLHNSKLPYFCVYYSIRKSKLQFL